jgi:elongation factor 2
MLAKLGRPLDIAAVREADAEQHRRPRKLTRLVMAHALPLGAALIGVMVRQLPSAAAAQRYRASVLANGCGALAGHIARCDAAGPLVAAVSGMMPTADHGRYYAICRVLSGTVEAGTRCGIVIPGGEPDHAAGEDTVFENRPVQRVAALAPNMDTAFGAAIGAGGLCAVVGIDRYVLCTATLTGVGGAAAACAVFQPSPCFAGPPLVRASLDVRTAADLPRLVQAVRRVVRGCSAAVRCEVEDTGEHTVSAAAEPPLRAFVAAVRAEMAALPLGRVPGPNLGLVATACRVTYREVATAASNVAVAGASPNRHNRFTAVMSPLAPGVVRAVERAAATVNVTGAQVDGIAAAVRAALNRQAAAEAAPLVPPLMAGSSTRLWLFGQATARGAIRSSPHSGNVVCTFDDGRLPLDEIQDAVRQGWAMTMSAGVVGGEQIRATRLDFSGIVLHADAIHRGAGQLIPAARRAASASFLRARPSLEEPMARVRVAAATAAGALAVADVVRGLGAVVLLPPDTRAPGHMCRPLPEANADGVVDVFYDLPVTAALDTNADCSVLAEMPLQATFGLADALAAIEWASPSVEAQWCCGWRRVAGDATQRGSPADMLARALRERKGLGPMPAAADFL